MPVERLPIGALPDSLNEAWPVFDGFFVLGAEHLRNCKTTLKNMYMDYTSWVTQIDNRWDTADPNKAKEAVNAELVQDGQNTRDLAYLLDFANKTGVFDPKFLPKASLVRQGLFQLTSMDPDTGSDNQNTAVTIGSAKKVLDKYNIDPNNIDVGKREVGWLNGNVQAVLPTEIITALTAGDDVMIEFIMCVRKKYNENDEVGYYPKKFLMTAKMWADRANVPVRNKNVYLVDEVIGFRGTIYHTPWYILVREDAQPGPGGTLPKLAPIKITTPYINEGDAGESERFVISAHWYKMNYLEDA